MSNRNPDDDFEEIDDEDDEAEAPPRRNILRLIILGILGLVVLCIICFVGLRFLPNNLLGALPFPIPGIPVGQVTATPVPGETVAPLPTTEQPPATEPAGGLTETPPPTEPPIATEELPPTTQPTGEIPPTAEPTGEIPATAEPTGEIPPTAEPTGEIPPTTESTVEPTDIVDEHGEELPTATATTIPVPGPTATPTLGAPSTDCSANVPPSAEAGGPYSPMMGKGEGLITVDGSGSSDSDGTIVKYEWDFGDGGALGEGQTATHGYPSEGGYVITLTVTDDCGATAQATVDVVVTGPTPPAPSTPSVPVEPAPPATTQPDNSVAGTIGFCYRVQPGNTLTGVAYYYGISVPLLAEVNGVSPDYYVFAGQGLFIPTSEVMDGPNLYEVQSGDTLNSIAFQCGLSTARLASANGLTPEQSLMPGQLLGIPLWSWY